MRPAGPALPDLRRRQATGLREPNTATTAPISPVALSILQAKLPDGTYLIPVPQTILQSGSNAGMGFSSFSFPSDYNEDHCLPTVTMSVGRQHFFVAGYLSTNQPAPVSRRSGRGHGHAGDSRRGRSPGATRGETWALSLKLTSILTPRSRMKRALPTRALFSRPAASARPMRISFGMTPVDPFFPFPRK